jgi:hypothetical protein
MSGRPAPDPIALVRLPDAERAPAYRNSLSARSHFGVSDFGGGVVGVAPAEGAGAIAEHFKAIKLCDTASDLSDPAIWQPLRANPPRQRSDVDPSAYREAMLQSGKEIFDRNPSLESEVVAFALAAFGAAEAGDLPNLLTVNLEPLFNQFPQGELWYVTVSEVLLARLAFGRAQLAFQLTPDMPIGEEMEQLRAFSDLSLTRGIDLTATLKVALLALSPAVLGLLIPAMPNALVFCFGDAVDLQRPYPTSFASLYRPNVLGNPEGLDRSALLQTSKPSDGVLLLRWWVDRLNRLYSHVADPTRFTDEGGFHDPSAQAAWMITLERLFGDAISLLAEPQATDLDRVQIAFDLLDKAESMLGYGRKRSGKGFSALLRRRQCLPRLREAFANLPDDLGERLAAESERLFDDLYTKVRGNTVGYRLTSTGAMIAQDEAENLVKVDNDSLVASVCRAVRNSSHGLLEMLRRGNDRFLLAANTGGIPAELPPLAALIALGLFADADGLIDGSWQTRLVARST